MLPIPPGTFLLKKYLPVNNPGAITLVLEHSFEESAFAVDM